MTSATGETAIGPANGVLLDPGRPLHVRHARAPLTLAVVSIAWLRARPDAARAAIETRHLGPAEAAHAATLHIPKRRLEWLAGRLAIKHAVRAYQRRHARVLAPPRDVRVLTVEYGLRAGKPYVDAPVGVGMSHSTDFAVAACGPRAVGVDLELNREMAPVLADLLALRPPLQPGRDGRRLAAMPVPLRWACKEAVLKYFGIGLRVDTREVRLTGWRADGRFSWHAGPELLRRVPAAAGSWRAHTWAREVDGYSLALVWR